MELTLVILLTAAIVILTVKVGQLQDNLATLTKQVLELANINNNIVDRL